MSRRNGTWTQQRCIRISNQRKSCGVYHFVSPFSVLFQKKYWKKYDKSSKGVLPFLEAKQFISDYCNALNLSPDVKARIEDRFKNFYFNFDQSFKLKIMFVRFRTQIITRGSLSWNELVASFIVHRPTVEDTEVCISRFFFYLNILFFSTSMKVTKQQSFVSFLKYRKFYILFYLQAVQLFVLLKCSFFFFFFFFCFFFFFLNF